ncbi:MAG TPA: TIGR01459 family HAD-type hydrolase [Stellaceae bacterium]|nr:TIGR01459 family HAD-type hydrolase [Stellaceae bacterium]
MGSEVGASDIPVLPGIAGIIDRYDAVILDVWGVLHDGAKPFPGVLDALRRLRAVGKATLVLSNAPRRAEPVAKRIAEVGIARDLYDHIHTSGEETWQHLYRRDDAFHAALGRACYHIAPSRESDVLDGLDLERVDDIAAAEFIHNTGPWGWDENVDGYEEMLQAARRRDLPMVCANPDLVVHHLGRRAICAGTIAQRYEAIGGKVRWHGKPYPGVYKQALDKLGIADPKRILGIGDSLRTDIAGANAAGIDAIVVAGGIHYEEFGCSGGRQPDPARIAKAAAAAGAHPIAALDQLRW